MFVIGTVLFSKVEEILYINAHHIAKFQQCADLQFNALVFNGLHELRIVAKSCTCFTQRQISFGAKVSHS